MRIAKVIDRCAPGRDQFVGDGDDRVQAHAPGINLPGVIGLSELKKRQHYLETQLEVLSRDIQRLEKRLEAEQNSVWMPASFEPPLEPASSTDHAPSEGAAMPASPPPIPPVLEMASTELQASAEATAAELAASVDHERRNRDHAAKALLDVMTRIGDLEPRHDRVLRVEQVRRGAATMAELSPAQLAARLYSNKDRGNLLIIVDQFERLETACPESSRTFSVPPPSASGPSLPVA